MKINIRGSGFRHTLPAVFSFSALWFVVLVLATPILTVSMMMSGLVPPALHREVWFFLLTRMPMIGLAGMALAVLTTTRVAGPMVPLRRAFEDVKHGDMDRRLSFRRTDEHFWGVEMAFNEMMVALSERADSQRRLEAEDQRATRPPQRQAHHDLHSRPA